MVGADRAAAAQALCAAHPSVDILVADDGLQHHRLHHDLALLVFDERGAGNGLLLPAGPLREPLLGNIIWAAQLQGAFFNGWWWWPLIPSFAMILILGALALVNMGLDELANPRVRRSE